MGSRSNAIVVILALAGIVAALAIGLRSAQRIPDEPQPVAWDRVSCAHCQMLVSEPAFAAQLITQDGEVLVFDDPGCALAYIRAQGTKIHRLWFYSQAAGGWLAPDDVAFAAVAHTPMGYGLMAVPTTTPGALSLEQARERVLRRDAERGER